MVQQLIFKGIKSYFDKKKTITWPALKHHIFANNKIQYWAVLVFFNLKNLPY